MHNHTKQMCTSGRNRSDALCSMASNMPLRDTASRAGVGQRNARFSVSLSLPSALPWCPSPRPEAKSFPSTILEALFAPGLVTLAPLYASLCTNEEVDAGL